MITQNKKTSFGDNSRDILHKKRNVDENNNICSLAQLYRFTITWITIDIFIEKSISRFPSCQKLWNWHILCMIMKNIKFTSSNTHFPDNTIPLNHETEWLTFLQVPATILYMRFFHNGGGRWDLRIFLLHPPQYIYLLR